jgi:hypothetical protein
VRDVGEDAILRVDECFDAPRHRIEGADHVADLVSSLLTGRPGARLQLARREPVARVADELQRQIVTAEIAGDELHITKGRRYKSS